MEMNEVGQIVHYHRKMSGLSQAELAKLAGLGKTVVYDIEKGKMSVRFETLLKIFRILNIRIELQSPLMKLYHEKSESIRR